ncbi:helicase [Seminavis robusta]|uniref:Helicase n=1 Tax=Seminavis robusta TaxID=568900 RepID=A0A9N8H2G5_9STRA|nr:helicase [Seminavis robusta]|eukprot:Sro8_g006860.1 helicase (667) ;mRNA; r:215615-218740
MNKRNSSGSSSSLSSSSSSSSTENEDAGASCSPGNNSDGRRGHGNGAATGNDSAVMAAAAAVAAMASFSSAPLPGAAVAPLANAPAMASVASVPQLASGMDVARVPSRAPLKSPPPSTTMAVATPPPAKKKRTHKPKRGSSATCTSGTGSSSTTNDTGSTPAHRTSSAEERWEDMHTRLLRYKQLHGDCQVPNRYPDDPKLGAWVSTQRRHYRVSQRDNVESTSLTNERIQRLEDAGFEWTGVNPRYLHWDMRYRELLDFKERFGHVNIPINWPENVKLANWTSTQRQEHKNMLKGKKSRLDDRRILMLNDIGFAWELQRGGRKRKLVATKKGDESLQEDQQDEDSYQTQDGGQSDHVSTDAEQQHANEEEEDSKPAAVVPHPSSAPQISNLVAPPQLLGQVPSGGPAAHATLPNLLGSPSFVAVGSGSGSGTSASVAAEPAPSSDSRGEVDHMNLLLQLSQQSAQATPSLLLQQQQGGDSIRQALLSQLVLLQSAQAQANANAQAAILAYDTGRMSGMIQAMQQQQQQHSTTLLSNSFQQQYLGGATIPAPSGNLIGQLQTLGNSDLSLSLGSSHNSNNLTILQRQALIQLSGNQGEQIGGPPSAASTSMRTASQQLSFLSSLVRNNDSSTSNSVLLNGALNGGSNHLNSGGSFNNDQQPPPGMC